VRSQARDLLGRDSESLNERNFMRILHDAHDADIIDLRRRGGDYEVAPAAAAPTVERQLEVAEKANAPAPKPQAPVVRGMGSRGIGRGPMGAKGGPPANLLTVGVVARAKPVIPASAAPTNTAKATDDAEAVAIVEASQMAAEPAAKPARGRKRAPAAKKAPRAAKTPRARKKTAAKTPTATSE
jgi:hypothetical protein